MIGAACSIFPAFKTGSSSGVGGRSRFSRRLHTVKERGEPGERESAQRVTVPLARGSEGGGERLGLKEPRDEQEKA